MLADSLSFACVGFGSFALFAFLFISLLLFICVFCLICGAGPTLFICAFCTSAHIVLPWVAGTTLWELVPHNFRQFLCVLSLVAGPCYKCWYTIVCTLLLCIAFSGWQAPHCRNWSPSAVFAFVPFAPLLTMVAGSCSQVLVHHSAYTAQFAIRSLIYSYLLSHLVPLI